MKDHCGPKSEWLVRKEKQQGKFTVLRNSYLKGGRMEFKTLWKSHSTIKFSINHPLFDAFYKGIPQKTSENLPTQESPCAKWLATLSFEGVSVGMLPMLASPCSQHLRMLLT